MESPVSLVFRFDWYPSDNLRDYVPGILLFYVNFVLKSKCCGKTDNTFLITYVFELLNLQWGLNSGNFLLMFYTVKNTDVTKYPEVTRVLYFTLHPPVFIAIALMLKKLWRGGGALSTLPPSPPTLHAHTPLLLKCSQMDRINKVKGNLDRKILTYVLLFFLVYLFRPNLRSITEV